MISVSLHVFIYERHDIKKRGKDSDPEHCSGMLGDIGQSQVNI